MNKKPGLLALATLVGGLASASSAHAGWVWKNSATYCQTRPYLWATDLVVYTAEDLLGGQCWTIRLESAFDTVALGNLEQFGIPLNAIRSAIKGSSDLHVEFYDEKNFQTNQTRVFIWDANSGLPTAINLSIAGYKDRTESLFLSADH